MELQYYVTNESNMEVTAEYERYFPAITSAVVKRLDLKKDYSFSVIFVNDEAIRTINRDYRKIDKETDVISFAALDDALPFELAAEEIELGDIFINVDAVKRQAKSYSHSEVREASFLFTHGILHLLGYDHMVPEEEKVMFALQDELLEPIVPRTTDETDG